MEDFFIELFQLRGKPSVQQAHKWLNHALAQYHRPSVNNNNYQHYASVLDVLRGMSKDDKWKNHKTKGADALTKDAVKKIFEAAIHDPETKKLCLIRLRNKALAILMIGNGWHTAEVVRIFDGDVEDFPDYEDRDGHKRPKLVFRGRKCKEYVGAKNTIGCGCRGPHTCLNTNCFYNCVKWYVTKKNQSDEHFAKVHLKKMSHSQRDGHLDNDGDLEPRRFFRSHPRKDKEHYPHRNMGRGQIQEVLEFWNKALGKNGEKMIPGVRLTTNQARKTFATFGHRYTTKIQGGAVPLPVGGANGRDPPQRPQPVCRDPKFIPIENTSATRRGTTWKKSPTWPGP